MQFLCIERNSLPCRSSKCSSDDSMRRCSFDHFESWKLGTASSCVLTVLLIKMQTTGNTCSWSFVLSSHSFFYRRDFEARSSGNNPKVWGSRIYQSRAEPFGKCHFEATCKYQSSLIIYL
ncbi:hypothetical protein ZIOFF_025880 [Zingiber officinale]|uniref:Uncharacterized protein n=1 Tax=Zingiber officinale TaxID=94328 RepID=A0A8J5GVM9_ZINOF|nr:hypothetical protein ZIOFF_025880 [Zingiber officinale]